MCPTVRFSKTHFTKALLQDWKTVMSYTLTHSFMRINLHGQFDDVSTSFLVSTLERNFFKINFHLMLLSLGFPSCTFQLKGPKVHNLSVKFRPLKISSVSPASVLLSCSSKKP